MTRYYVKKIKRLSHKPEMCIVCNGQNLIEDAILSSIGPSPENTSYAPSILCMACETLMIITTDPGEGLGLQASVGNELSMRN